MEPKSAPPRRLYISPLGTAAFNARLTWDEWCAWQARRTGRREQLGDAPYGERELAHLRFVRWLCRSGRLAP